MNDDRPLAAAAEQAAAALAAAEQRGAERERAAIALILRLRAKTLRGRKALGLADEIDALASYVEQRGDPTRCRPLRLRGSGGGR